MKKKIASIIMIMMCALLLQACNQKSEYDIDEFGKMFNETQELFEKESEYMTTDELFSDKGYNLYKKCSKKTGLPFNKEVTLRGKKVQLLGAIGISSNDNNYVICCKFSSPVNNIGIFIPDDQNVIVKGIFSKIGGMYGWLSDTEIISPEKINIEFKDNNVASVISSIPDDISSVDSMIYGEVTDILTLDELKNNLSKLIDFDNGFFFNKVARIDGIEGKEGTIYFTYDEDRIGVLTTGDKLAIKGRVHSIGGFTDSNGDYVAIGGIIDAVYDCYNFTTAK